MSVIWITGLAGAGKSSVAAVVAQRLRQQQRAVLVLDGDAVRQALGEAGQGYARTQRLAVAQRIANLAQLASVQQLCVVVATISLFHAIHAANRLAMADYFEVLLHCPLHVLQQRRAIYAQASAPRVGLEIAAEFPQSAHLSLRSDEHSVDALADQLLSAWALRHV